MTGIAERRLRSQRLFGEPFPHATDAVGWLTAVQSQDYGAAKWALAQRLDGVTDAALDRLFDEGAFLRTHAMRPTWHFLLPDDIHWVLELTSPRLMAGLAGRHRQLELDPTTIARAVQLFGEALVGGRFLTRPELGEVLTAAAISPEGQRLPHLLRCAEARAVIVSGPRRGKQMTYALLEERAPKARRLDQEAALAELTLRYFRSHGPAQAKDFAWWSGLTLAEVRRGLAAVAAQLEQEAIDGREYWSAPGVGSGAQSKLVAHLLPNFDEFTVAYRDRSALLNPEVRFEPSVFAYYRDASPQGGLLSNVLTIGGQVRGAWRRTPSARLVRIDVTLLGPLGQSERNAVAETAAAYARFLKRAVELRFDHVC